MAPRTDPACSWSRMDSLTVVCLLALGILIRLPNLLQPYVINTDAIKYVQAAQIIAQKDLWEGLEISKPSLFPILIALFGPAVDDFLTAARLISVTFSLLTLLPLFLLSRELLGRSVAWIPCLLYCISPAILANSLDIVRDPLFWFAFASYLWVFLSAIRKNHWLLYLSAGCLVLLSVSIRLEGLMLIPASIGFLLYKGLREKENLLGLTRAAWLLLPTALLAAVLILPQLEHQRAIALRDWNAYLRQAKAAVVGEDQVEQRMERNIARSRPRSAQVFFDTAWENRHALFAWDLLKHWIHAAHPLFFLLALLGLCQKMVWKESRWHFFALLMAAWLIMGYVRISGSLVISKRHLIPLVIVGYLYAAVGFSWLVQGCNRRWPGISRKSITVVLIAILVIVATLQSQKTTRRDKLARRHAGEWIRTLDISQPLIVTNRPRIGFYGGGICTNTERLPREPSDQIVFLRHNLHEKERIVRKRLKRILSASPRSDVLFAFAQRAGEPLSKRTVATLASKRWEFYDLKTFESPSETIFVYCFKRS